MSTPSQNAFTSKLASRTILILGGTSGVGLGAAKALLSCGANVIISSSRESRLSESLATLRSSIPSTSSSPTAIAGFTCDLASPDVESNLATLFSQVSEHLTSTLHTTRLDHLIFTAGDSLAMLPVPEVTLSAFNAAIQVRGAAALLAVKAFLPLLPSSNTTSITLTSGSISDKPIAGGWAVVAFVGAGLTGLTRQLAFDLKPIRVNCVAPGVVDTNLWSGMGEKEKRGLFEGMARELPTGRVPDADDVAESYVYLVRARNVTGTVVHTNGGAFLG